MHRGGFQNFEILLMENGQKEKRKREEEASQQTTEAKQETENHGNEIETNAKENIPRHKNIFESFIDFMKDEFAENEPNTAELAAVDEYEKSKNLIAENVELGSTTWRNMFPEFSVPIRSRDRELGGSNTFDSFGTRDFIPAFMGCVAFLSATMILFALCRWLLYRTFRRKRKSRKSEKKPSNLEKDPTLAEESYKLHTFEPSAPVEFLVEQRENAANPHIREENKLLEERARAITEFRLRHQMAVEARRAGNPTSLLPLLERVFGRVNECENCRHPFSSQRCHMMGPHQRI